jgi:phosphatidylglycerol:prolipoprotein diacylglycerol transferase
MFFALLFVYIYTKRQKMDTLLQFDILAVCIPLFHFFGRIGCFLGGCCYGIESEFGFTFTQSPIEFANGVNRFPVQLLEAAVLLIIFLVLLQLFNREIQSGNLILLYFLFYGTARFFIEFLRDDFYRGIWGIFSTSQWISVALVTIAVFLLIARRAPRRLSRLK